MFNKFKDYFKGFLIWFNKNYTRLLLGKDYDELFKQLEEDKYI